MSTQDARTIATSLRVIRIALTASVLGFAVIARTMIDADALRADPAVDAAMMRWINLAVLAAGAVAIVVLHRRHAGEPDPRRRQTLNVIAWATGEMAAFLGIVHWMLVGNPLPFYAGLAMMLCAFVLVPIRE
jgi:hypothetical protein